jgi:3-oxoacyl-[acyl-carrier-protein] synthase-3
LGLGKDVACFDINQGCSGWVYGLWVAGGLVESGACSRVLLCAGDTISQIIHPRDRAVLPLFGDAGTATLVTRREHPGDPLVFSMHSDGAGHAAICVPHGGARIPLGLDSSAEATDAEGNVRTPANLLMNGLEVFNFTLREEPGAVKTLLSLAGVPAADLDHLVFHQANRFILTNLAKRVGVPLEKTPMATLANYGNQSSASIPFVLANELSESLCQSPRMILASGFGVGLLI